MSADVKSFVEEKLQHRPKDVSLFELALTHSSAGPDSYERLEFLGDRVLGLTIARALYERYPKEPEGKLSRRYNALVARETCAEVGYELGIPALLRLGKQARDDRANQSDNVVGDAVESLLGALLLDGGLQSAEQFVMRMWGPYLAGQVRAPEHPKSALQELAAARNWRAPQYELVSRTGAHHAPIFSVRVSIRDVGEAEGEGSSKQEAETAAATELLTRLK